jgi:hypothetical protein
MMKFIAGIAVGEVLTVLTLWMGYNWYEFRKIMGLINSNKLYLN